VPFLLKKSLGQTGGPASNQTKIYIFLKIIKKLESFRKKNRNKINKYIKIVKNEDRQNKNRKNKNMKQT